MNCTIGKYRMFATPSCHLAESAKFRRSRPLSIYDVWQTMTAVFRTFRMANEQEIYKPFTKYFRSGRRSRISDNARSCCASLKIIAKTCEPGFDVSVLRFRTVRKHFWSEVESTFPPRLISKICSRQRVWC